MRNIFIVIYLASGLGLASRACCTVVHIVPDTVHTQKRVIPPDARCREIKLKLESRVTYSP